MSKMTGFSTIATAGIVAFNISACTESNSDDIKKAGFTPIETVHKASCYDYSGNLIASDESKKNYTLTSAGFFRDDEKFAVLNSAGCVVETNYAEISADAKLDASVNLVVTAGQKIVLHESFSSISTGETTTTFNLNAPDGTKLRKVTVFGLTSVASDKKTSVGPDIKRALGL